MEKQIIVPRIKVAFSNWRINQKKKLKKKKRETAKVPTRRKFFLSVDRGKTTPMHIPPADGQ